MTFSWEYTPAETNLTFTAAKVPAAMKRVGSAFEPWEYDDGGVDQKGLSVSASFTSILLAVDQSDPARVGV